MVRALIAIAALGLMSAAFFAATGHPAHAQAVCNGTAIHYAPFRGFTQSVRETPWIRGSPAGSGIVGHLAYYDSSVLSDGRFNDADGAVAYASSSSQPQTPMKIIWTVAKGGVGQRTHISGRQLDGSGSFSVHAQQMRREGKTAYVAAPAFPQPGCWRLSVTIGQKRAGFDIRVVAAPPGAACDGTPLRPVSSDPNVPRQPWFRARPSSSAVSGYLFYEPPGGMGAGLSIYTGGDTPSGGTTKILWVPRAPGRTLEILARRLDSPGTFRQTLPPAGGGSFPSIPDVPEPGCWLLKVRTGSTTAIVVAHATTP